MTTPTVQECIKAVSNFVKSFTTKPPRTPIDVPIREMTELITAAQSAERLQKLMDEAKGLPELEEDNPVFKIVITEKDKYAWGFNDCREKCRPAFAKLTEENERLKEELEICRDANTQKKKEAQRLRDMFAQPIDRIEFPITKEVWEKFAHAALSGEGK